MYIKKLVMHGFKSFVKKTEIPFTEGINVILGPNGSGKSNVSDALCFVLGRLSVKSMRAAKASNLIFMGSKTAPPAKEASVEMVFENEDKTFSINTKEISIKRIVRKNGQSVYKINNETKTRQDVLSLLAQAGIDPNGFNIVLQGEIQNFVRMQTEERRKIIEEVSGISIYEIRKEKSIKELDKTEERLKEVIAILRERTAYLNNLEKERQQALKFQKLQQDERQLKASIIFQDLSKKKKESEGVLKEIEKRDKDIEKIKKLKIELEGEISSLEAKINHINSNIQKSAGLEQERLNQEIANLRAEIAGLTVRLENHENKLNQIQKQKIELKESIRDNELSVRELQKESPTIAKKEKEINEKKKELEKLEGQRKKFYTTKSELKSIRERIEEKEKNLSNLKNESDFVLKQIDSIASELFDSKSTSEKVSLLKSRLNERIEVLRSLDKREVELGKTIHTGEYEIENQKKLVDKISKLDVCPVCKNKITENHVSHIKGEIAPKLKEIEEEIHKSKSELSKIKNDRQEIKQEADSISQEISKRESDLNKLSNIETKKEQIKSLRDKIESLNSEISEMKKKKDSLERNFDENSNIEQKYELLNVEMQEVSLRSEENVNSEISFKQRELERAKIALKQSEREEEDLKEDLKEIKESLEEKETILEKKKSQEGELSKKFQKSIEERDGYQRNIRDNEVELNNKRNEIHNVEQQTNELKIDKARFDAEVENLEIEMLEFPNIEIIRTNKESLLEKIHRVQEILSKIGSVNLRSLEVYSSVKEEYDKINNKVEIISKEKEGIMKIIHEIDIKKKKAFLGTLQNLNDIFSRNFAQISTKGQVFLELENKKEPFEGGVSIVVKTGHGKYFDVTSLSGGEQTMVALSLIFAIQEFKPYCFYILDEIDAALDKRNSERLASLLKKYMQKGQYIVITHNDEVITNATNLFGVSMHEGISKIISLKL